MEFKFYLTATEPDEKGDDVKTSRAFDNNWRESTLRLHSLQKGTI